MTAKQTTYSYDTIDDFRVGYDFQKEWIRGKGILLLMALFFGAVGGGVFLTSAIIDWKWGLAIGLGIVAVGKGGSHLAFLGHPGRAWRILTKPQNSWISRGFWFMGLFLIFGTVYFFFQDNRAVELIAGFWAFWLVAYTGFEMASATGISFWNNGLLPVVFTTTALWSGASVAQFAHAVHKDIGMDASRLEDLSLIAGIAAIVALMSYMVGSFSSLMAARQSALMLTKGEMAPLFYGGVVFLGLIVPIAILIPAYLDEMGRSWLAAAGFSQLAGGFFLRYALLRVGLYPPVI